MKVLTTYDEIYNHVKKEYYNDDVELSSLFFDFDVKATYKVLLDAYIDLQNDINGDSVLHLSDVEFEKMMLNQVFSFGDMKQTQPKNFYPRNMKVI